jgi:AcrR family transcriptional regulator
MGSEERRQREQQELRRRILATAREIAREEGWSAVTLRKIADRIEYTHAALYSYFANKEQLLLEVLREGFGLLATDLASSSVGAETALIAFRRFVFAYWNFAWRHPELYRVMYGLDGIPFGVTETWREGVRIGELAAEVVERLLVDQGKPVEQIETKISLFWSAMHGLISLIMAGRIAGEPGELTPLVEQYIQDTLTTWHISTDVQADEHAIKTV